MHHIRFETKSFCALMAARSFRWIDPENVPGGKPVGGVVPGEIPRLQLTKVGPVLVMAAAAKMKFGIGTGGEGGGDPAVGEGKIEGEGKGEAEGGGDLGV